jgi:alpha-glucosidase (family GH31 glycosyl hydrolase)
LYNFRWIAPEDKIAQEVNDEYLLGETILVAPVIVEGATKRDVYLPGHFKWQDGNTLEIHQGPKWLLDYDAPLTTLPYFIRQ